MEKYITDERIGLKYELIGDYCFLAGDDEPEEHRPIGKWGELRRQYLREHMRCIYYAMLMSGTLYDHLADVNEQAEEMLFQLVKQMAKDEGVTEALKQRDQMAWIGAMNNIRNRATEIVSNELIYS